MYDSGAMKSAIIAVQNKSSNHNIKFSSMSNDVNITKGVRHHFNAIIRSAPVKKEIAGIVDVAVIVGIVFVVGLAITLAQKHSQMAQEKIQPSGNQDSSSNSTTDSDRPQTEIVIPKKSAQDIIYGN